MQSSSQAATEFSGTLLTLNVLRRGSTGIDVASVVPPDAFQPVPVVAEPRPSLIEVFLQVDDKRILVQQCGRTQSTEPTVTTATETVPQLTSISPICLALRDSAETKELLITGQQLQCDGSYVRARCQGNFLPVTCGPVQEDAGSPGALPGQQCVVARLQGIPASGALVLVELQHGAALSGWKPLVVLPSSKAAREVNTLQDKEQGPMSSEFLVADLGRWLDYASCFSSSGTDAGPGKMNDALSEEVAVAADASGGPSRVQYYTNASEYRAAVMQAVPRDRILATGLQLLSTAADYGWPHTCELLLESLLSVGVEYDWVVGMISARGPSLLLRAVRSKSIETVHTIYGMGEARGQRWKWDACDAHGVTPLHVAAVLEDGQMGLAIIRKYPLAARLWNTARAFDGMSPADCAARCGHTYLNAVVQRRLKELATPYQSQDKEEGSSQDGRSQRLLSNHGLLPEEVQRLVLEATAQARACVAGAAEIPGSPPPVTTKVAGGASGAAVAAAPWPKEPLQLLRCCTAGGFAAALETRYQAHRTVQTLQQDQVVYPLLVVLLALAVGWTHLAQGGAFAALFTVLLDMAGQMLSMFVLLKFPKAYLRKRQNIWLCTQLVRPVLVLAVACGMLPLPLSWVRPSLMNSLAHAVLLPCLEHFTIVQSASVRGASAIAELAVVLSNSGATMWLDAGQVLAVRVCGVFVSGMVDFQARATFLGTTKSN